MPSLRFGAIAAALVVFGVPAAIAATAGASATSLLSGAAGGGVAISGDCLPAGFPATGGSGGYTPEQISIAATIIAVGRRMGVPLRGWVVAIAAAMQESGLRDLNYGDRDSLGVFQQRPSQGWGTPAQVMDVTHAATSFYQHLLAIPGWQTMPIGDAAQAVQRSAYPEAYAPHETAAQRLVDTLTDAACSATGSTG